MKTSIVGDPKRSTVQEEYVLREIRADLKNYQKRVSFMSILTKSYFVFLGGRFLFNNLANMPLQIILFASLVYGLKSEWFNQAYLTPRLRHYLKLTQLGPDFALQ
jgi:hypothetical protein